MYLESLYFREPTCNQTPEYCILSVIDGSKPLINRDPKTLMADHGDTMLLQSWSYGTGDLVVW